MRQNPPCNAEQVRAVAQVQPARADESAARAQRHRGQGGPADVQ